MDALGILTTTTRGQIHPGSLAFVMDAARVGMRLDLTGSLNQLRGRCWHQAQPPVHLPQRRRVPGSNRTLTCLADEDVVETWRSDLSGAFTPSRRSQRGYLLAVAASPGFIKPPSRVTLTQDRQPWLGRCDPSFPTPWSKRSLPCSCQVSARPSGCRRHCCCSPIRAAVSPFKQQQEHSTVMTLVEGTLRVEPRQ